jgi:hypothetical protein
MSDDLTKEWLCVLCCMYCIYKITALRSMRYRPMHMNSQYNNGEAQVLERA